MRVSWEESLSRDSSSAEVGAEDREDDDAEGGGVGELVLGMGEEGGESCMVTRSDRG